MENPQKGDVPYTPPDCSGMAKNKELPTSPYGFDKTMARVLRVKPEPKPEPKKRTP